MREWSQRVVIGATVTFISDTAPTKDQVEAVVRAIIRHGVDPSAKLVAVSDVSVGVGSLTGADACDA